MQKKTVEICFVDLTLTYERSPWRGFSSQLQGCVTGKPQQNPP